MGSETMEAGQKSAGVPRGVVIFSYLLASISVTILFYLLASSSGRHSNVEIVFGAGWTFLLSLIVSASILPGLLKKIYGGGRDETKPA